MRGPRARRNQHEYGIIPALSRARSSVSNFFGHSASSSTDLSPSAHDAQTEPQPLHKKRSMFMRRSSTARLKLAEKKQSKAHWEAARSHFAPKLSARMAEGDAGAGSQPRLLSLLHAGEQGLHGIISVIRGAGSFLSNGASLVLSGNIRTHTAAVGDGSCEGGEPGEVIAEADHARPSARHRHWDSHRPHHHSSGRIESPNSRLAPQRSRVSLDSAESAEQSAAAAEAATAAAATSAAAAAAAAAATEAAEGAGPAEERRASLVANKGWRGSGRGSIVEGIYEHREALAERRRMRLLPHVQKLVDELWGTATKVRRLPSCARLSHKPARLRSTPPQHATAARLRWGVGTGRCSPYCAVTGAT